MDEETRRKINDYIQQDHFARLLGANVEILKPGHSRVTITVTEGMLNFHGNTHGGLIFSLGDIAFAAAGNSRGQTLVALNVTMNFLKATGPGDQLVAEAIEQYMAGPTGLYDITIRNVNTGELVAKSQDLAYRKKEWFITNDDQRE